MRSVAISELKLGWIQNALELKVSLGVLGDLVEHRMRKLILHALQEIGAVKYSSKTRGRCECALVSNIHTKFSQLFPPWIHHDCDE